MQSCLSYPFVAVTKIIDGISVREERFILVHSVGGYHSIIGGEAGGVAHSVGGCLSIIGGEARGAWLTRSM